MRDLCTSHRPYTDIQQYSFLYNFLFSSSLSFQISCGSLHLSCMYSLYCVPFFSFSFFTHVLLSHQVELRPLFCSPHNLLYDSVTLRADPVLLRFLARTSTRLQRIRVSSLRYFARCASMSDFCQILPLLHHFVFISFSPSCPVLDTPTVLVVYMY